MGLKNKLHKLSKDIDGEHFQNSTKKNKKQHITGLVCIYCITHQMDGYYTVVYLTAIQT